MNSKILQCDLENLTSLLFALETDTLLFVIDNNIYSLYGNEFSLIEKIQQQGKRIVVWKSIEGEKTKTFSEYQSCMEFFLGKGIHRNCILVAIGGGATTDFGGFVAATLLRGIKWISIPTSLLSMVDAGIGGKTGINSSFGKNLLGSFHLPEKVLINLDFINTLPPSEIQSGLGEMVKYAFLNDSIYESLTKRRDFKIQILNCAVFKQQIVEKDFLELGERKHLNLGHTFGHAIEKVYNIPHGISVVWGMALLFYLIQDGRYLKELSTLLESLNWGDLTPPWYNKKFPSKDLFEYLLKDKKRSGNVSIDLITLEGIGRPKIEKFLLDTIEKKLDDNEIKLRNFSL